MDDKLWAWHNAWDIVVKGIDCYCGIRMYEIIAM